MWARVDDTATSGSRTLISHRQNELRVGWSSSIGDMQLKVGSVTAVGKFTVDRQWHHW